MDESKTFTRRLETVMDMVYSLFFVTLVLVFSLTACSTNGPQGQATPSIRCPPLPAGFKESDLIGTWVAKYGGGDIDTLIIREDGTYKQIYSDALSGYHFESDWKKWWTEHRSSGFLRLHMQGMHRYDDIGSLRDRETGGVGDLPAIDYCEGKGVEMRDEIVLIATGVSERNAPFVPRGIWLRHLRLTGREFTYSFELQN